MKNTTLILALLTLGIAINLQGQFTQITFFKSLDKTTFNLLSNHNLNDAKSLNLTTLGFFEKYKSSENQDFNEVGIQPTLFWGFSKSFSIGPSIYYNSIAGFAQRISVKYVVKNERLMIVLIPTIGHYQQVAQIYAETFAQFQFNVPLKASISFWVNGQFLNVWDAFKTHSRSYQQLSMSISIKRHQFGVGIDLGGYGPQAYRTNDIGIYYRGLF